MTEHLRLLLQLISNDADVSSLVKRGLTYSQITTLMVSAVDAGYLSLVDGRLSVTQAGRSALSVDVTTGQRESDGGFISPRTEFRTAKLDPEAIFLPVRRHSFF